MVNKTMPLVAFGLLLISFPGYGYDPLPGCIIAYADADYQGGKNILCLNGKEEEIITQDNLFEDSVSSIKVGPGVAARACEHPDGSGICRSYFHSAPNVGEVMNDKISTIRLTAFNPDDFTMIFAGGPEYPRSCVYEDLNQCPDNKAYNRKLGRQHAQNFSVVLNSIAKLSHGQELTNAHKTPAAFTGGASHAGYLIGKSTVAGLAFTGPMTSGRNGEIQRTSDSYSQEGVDVYPGLGKTDYQPGENACGDPVCIKHAMDYMRSQVRSLNPTSFDFEEGGLQYQFPLVRKDHTGSLAYSWDVGNVHFIQLHDSLNTETHRYDSWGGLKNNVFTINDAAEWLKKDLDVAHSAGKKIVLLLRHWDQKSAFLESLVRKYKINAIFAYYKTPLDGRYRDVHGANTFLEPVQLGGPAHKTMMLARFKGKDVYVAMIRIKNNGDYTTTLLQGKGFSQ